MDFIAQFSPESEPLLDRDALLACETRLHALSPESSASEGWPVSYPQLQPRDALSAETRLAMEQYRNATEHPVYTYRRLRWTINNTVHVTVLVNRRTGRPFRPALNEVYRATALLGTQYNVQRFPKIVIRYGREMRNTHLIFNTGKVVETGKMPFATKRAVLGVLLDYIRAIGYPEVGVGSRVCQNLVANGNLGFKVRLRLLQYLNPLMVHLEPEKFPGAIIRHPELCDQADIDDILSGASALGYAENAQTEEEEEEEEELALDEPLAEDADPDEAAGYMDLTQDILCGAGDGDSEPDVARTTSRIAILVFEHGKVNCVGAKTVTEAKHAYEKVYEMLEACADTPENRARETQLIGAPPDESTVPTAPRKRQKARKLRPLSISLHKFQSEQSNQGTGIAPGSASRNVLPEMLEQRADLLSTSVASTRKRAAESAIPAEKQPPKKRVRKATKSRTRGRPHQNMASLINVDLASIFGARPTPANSNTGD